MAGRGVNADRTGSLELDGGGEMKPTDKQLADALFDLHAWAEQWCNTARYKRSREYCAAMDRAEQLLEQFEASFDEVDDSHEGNY